MIRTRTVRLLLGAAVASLLLACSDVTDPTHNDIGRAHSEWVAADVSTYSFLIETEASFNTNTGPFTVHVRNDSVVLAVGPNGDAWPGFDFTIDSLWNRVIAAYAYGVLNEATFMSGGVPAEVDMGYWPANEGIRFRVRWFDPAQ